MILCSDRGTHGCKCNELSVDDYVIEIVESLAEEWAPVIDVDDALEEEQHESTLMQDETEDISETPMIEIEPLVDHEVFLEMDNQETNHMADM